MTATDKDLAEIDIVANLLADAARHAVQFIGFPFSILFGRLAGRIGARNGILVGLVAGALLGNHFHQVLSLSADGAAATFEILVDTATAGVKSGTIEFGNNDSDENPFNFTISGTVTAVQTVQIVDNAGEQGDVVVAQLLDPLPRGLERRPLFVLFLLALLEDVLLVPNTALRFTPPKKKVKKQSSILGGLFSRRPHGSSKTATTNDTKEKKFRVYILKDGQPVQVPVQVGASDGQMTQITGGKLKAGMPVIVDTIAVSK